jgi:hypothetical protein
LDPSEENLTYLKELLNKEQTITTSDNEDISWGSFDTATATVKKANEYKYGNGYLKAIGTYTYDDAKFANATSGFALYDPARMTEKTEEATGNYV